MTASARTWATYARATVHWCHYAGLIQIRGERVTLGTDTRAVHLLAVTRGPFSRTRTFPQCGPDPTLKLLHEIVDRKPAGVGPGTLKSTKGATKALTNLVALGVVRNDGTIDSTVVDALKEHGQLPPVFVRALLERVPGAIDALARLASRPNTSAVSVGSLLRDGQGLTWAVETTRSAGKYFRAWARRAGIPARRTNTSGQLSLPAFGEDDANRT